MEVTVQVSHDAYYCSQQRTRALTPRIGSIERGVDRIDQILQKELLCWCDVEDINRIYQAIDQLEKRTYKIPERNSDIALNAIINKIKRIACAASISANDLISLYHLQNFLDNELNIKYCFNQAFERFERTPDNLEIFATHLPYCHSIAQFDQDTQSLIKEEEKTVALSRVLNQKRETLKKFKLQERMSAAPESCPAYFDELLENGYIYLCDHLMDMQTLLNRQKRLDRCYQLPFEELCRIVLEAKCAIAKKVTSSIFAEENIAEVIFLIGDTGAGKSTTLAFLRGDIIQLGLDRDKTSDASSEIGFDPTRSKTLLPNVQIIRQKIFVDLPGFQDSNGPLVALAIELALRELVDTYPSKVIVCAPLKSENRCKSASDLGKRLDSLFQNKADCILAFTKYSEHVVFKDIQKDFRREAKKTRRYKEKIEKLEVNDPSLSQRDIDEKQANLAKVQQKQQLYLNKTKERHELQRQRESVITQLEQELAKEIGLQRVIRLDYLERGDCLEARWGELNLSEQLQINASIEENLVSAEDVKLFSDRFVNSCLKATEAKLKGPLAFESFAELCKSIKSYGLVSTLHPEYPHIQEFLVLPGAQILSRRLDLMVMNRFISYCTYEILREFEVYPLLNKLNVFKQEYQDKKALTSKIRELEFCCEGLVKAVIELKGCEPQLINNCQEQWDELKKHIRVEVDERIKAKFEIELSGKQQGVLILGPIRALYKVKKLFTEMIKKDLENSVLLELIRESILQVSEIKVKLQDLVGLKQLTQQRNE